MRLIVVLLAVAAAAYAKPYAFTEVAPYGFHYGAVPYSVYGAHVPLAYSAVPAPYFHHASPVVAPFVAPVVAPAVGVKTQYHAQDILGQATYGHAEPHQSHTAVQDAAGNKVGSFSYVKPDGSVARTDYVADALGYRVSSNDLPVAPVHTAAPVADTPEVVAARAAHMTEVAKARSRTRRQAVLPASTSPLVHHVSPFFHHVAPVAYTSVYPHHVPVVTPGGYLADTPEVALAKVAHFAAHAEAASRVKRQVFYSSPYAAPLHTVAVNPLVRTVPTAYGYTATHHVPVTTAHTVHYAY